MPYEERVLIADDSPEDREIIKDSLTNLHCDFEIADNLEEAHDRVMSFLPVLVILDISLPRFRIGTGTANFDDISSFIRRHNEKHAVVILTGHAQQDQVSLAMAAGAVDYIDKAKLRDRKEFESRIRQAFALHLAISSKADSAETRKMMAEMRANTEIILRDQKIGNLRVGEVSDRTLELAKKQAYERGTKDRDEWWRKRVFAAFTTLGWLFYGLGKYLFERFTERK